MELLRGILEPIYHRLCIACLLRIEAQILGQASLRPALQPQIGPLRLVAAQMPRLIILIGAELVSRLWRLQADTLELCALAFSLRDHELLDILQRLQCGIDRRTESLEMCRNIRRRPINYRHAANQEQPRDTIRRSRHNPLLWMLEHPGICDALIKVHLHKNAVMKCLPE